MLTKTLTLISTLLVFSAASATASGDYELWKVGRAAWYQEDWQKAVDAYRSLIKKFPDSPLRCKSEYHLGYSLNKMGKEREAFEIFTQHIELGECQQSTLDDAKSTRLQIAYDLAKDDSAMRQVLLDSLKDANPDIRLSAAVWLSKLDDPSGIEVFFQILKTEDDQDRRDTAAKHILKMGSESDKKRLEKILDEHRATLSTKKPKMIRLIIRDQANNRETVKLNLPIQLFNLVIKSLSDQQLDLIEEQSGIDLNNFQIDIENLRAGTILFEVQNDSEQIKLFLE